MMRQAIELVTSIKEDLGKSGTVSQYSVVNGESYWPELEVLEFRLEIETLMYREDPTVKQVYFTKPEDQVGWAIHVVRAEADDGISN